MTKASELLFYLISLQSMLFGTMDGFQVLKRSGNDGSFPGKQFFLDENKSNGKGSWYSGLKRLKRDSHSQCPKLEGTPKKHQFSLRDDDNVNMKLFWVGEGFKTQLLLTTFDLQVIVWHLRMQSKLYKSNDDGLTFERVEGKLKKSDFRTNYGIVKNEKNPSKVIIIGFTKSGTSELYVTRDGAKTWDVIKLPFRVRNGEPILVHPNKEDWLLALESGGSRAAWISLDFGLNWRKLKDDAYSVKWGAVAGHPEDERTIFITIKDFYAGLFVSATMSLWRSKDLGKTFHLLHNHIYSLGIQGGFLFISIDLDQRGQTRVMHVSKDNGDDFHRVHVPEVTPERFYAILDMSEGQIFLHVDEPNDTGKGTLFVSDDDGIMYAESLENHFYTNDAVTDFYRVESMRGVFLTHQMLEGNTLRSVITFDRGATWHDLYLTDEQCKGSFLKKNAKCSLHYHSTFSQLKGHVVQGPLSTSSALGIIMLHGVSGDALHTNHTSVYMSINGGYNWTKVLDGPHHYAIGDHGNLIVAVPKDLQSNTTGNVLQYSLDQGRCWNSLKFSDDQLMIRGLVTEPHSKKRTFSIWGVIKGDQKKTWQVVTINFEKLLTKKCENTDLEYWSPHAIGRKDGCFLGIKEQYPRVKQDVFCYNGGDYKPKIIKEHCTCTFNDLECEYGYRKDVAGKCFRDQSVKLEFCRNGDEEKINEGKGYRRIPGDQCKGGEDVLVQKITTYIDTKIPCKAKDLDSYGFSQTIKKADSKKKSINKGALAFGIILVISIVIGCAVYIVRKVMASRDSSSTFRYSQLSSNESDDLIEEVNGYDPRPKGVRPYQDESDFESDAEMLKL